MKLFVVMSAICLISSGCHLDMDDQPKYKPLSSSSFYHNGQSSRPLIEGTVPRGSVQPDEFLYTGKRNGNFADAFPFPVTHQVLDRGKDRFTTFCTPCHGQLGDGLGMIVQRGFPQPPSFHADSVRAEPAGFYFDVITHGFGRMFSYAPSVPVNDRWAIVAYIRALQMSRRIPISEIPDSIKTRLAESH
ncbi:MAG TPA: cytochrome c [Bacteroidota bacterium]|nr:cytochrome c [Bacteroidota bacterium]